MDTGLEAINYINFSALAYAQFEDNARDYDIGYILKNKLYSNTEDFKTSKLELSTLQNFPILSAPGNSSTFFPTTKTDYLPLFFRTPKRKRVSVT
jgi:hypothetical protein